MDFHLRFTEGSEENVFFPVSAFSTYSHKNGTPILPSQSQDTTDIKYFLNPELHLRYTSGKNDEKIFLHQKKGLPKSSIFPYSPSINFISDQIRSRSSPDICQFSLFDAANLRRQRGEKKPIPDEQKDDRYYERRRRNNQAAKKSRDARKFREDQIALRATILEHENAILRAQLLTLREEASSLRQMLVQKKSIEIVSRDSHLSIS